MPDPDLQPVKPSSIALLVGRVAGALLLLMFITALFGDLFVWAICGTKFVLSPNFHQAESWLGALLFVSFMSFVGLDKGLEHFEQRRWRPFLVGGLTFMIASLPFAKLCALLIRFAMIRSFVVVAQPRFAWLVALLLLSLACKFRTAFNLWKLIRKASKPRETRRIVIPG